MRCILAEGQIQSLTEISNSRVSILDEILQLQSRSRWHLSRCAGRESSLSLLIYCSLGILEFYDCLVILSEWRHWVLVIKCSLGCSGDPDYAIFICLKGIFNNYAHYNVRAGNLFFPWCGGGYLGVWRLVGLCASCTILITFEKTRSWSWSAPGFSCHSRTTNPG